MLWHQPPEILINLAWDGTQVSISVKNSLSDQNVQLLIRTSELEKQFKVRRKRAVTCSMARRDTQTHTAGKPTPALGNSTGCNPFQIYFFNYLRYFNVFKINPPFKLSCIFMICKQESPNQISVFVHFGLIDFYACRTVSFHPVLIR